MDDYKIMMSNARNKKLKIMYSESDIDEVMARTEGCENEETIYLDERIKATFLDNGHLPGAAMILVQISYYGEETLNLLFTGDYKAKSLWREIKDVPSGGWSSGSAICSA
jgi:Cft2 family RNA processing exonuclease